MKHSIYIRLVLILMLTGVWGSVRGQYYSAKVDNFSFDFSYTGNACLASTATVSDIKIYSLPENRIRLKCIFTIYSVPTTYEEEIKVGEGFPEFNIWAVCNQNAESRRIYFKPDIQTGNSRGLGFHARLAVGVASGFGSGTSTTRIGIFSLQYASSELKSNTTANCLTESLQLTGSCIGSSYANGKLSIETPLGNRDIQDVIPDDNFNFSLAFPNIKISDYYSNLPDNSLITFLLKIPGVPDRTFSRRVYRVVTPTITSNKDLSCYGEPITLNSNITSSNVNYSWSNGSNAGPNITVNPSNTTDYSLTVSRGSERVCATKSSDKKIIYFAPFTPIISTLSNEACEDAGITLTAFPDNNVTYLWSNGKTDRNIQVNQAGNYTVEVKPNNGCAPRKSGAVGSNLVFYKPIEGEKIDLSKSDGVICANGDNNITLTAGAIDETGVNYSWTGPGFSENKKIVTVKNAGDYTVIMSRGNCRKIKSQKIERFDFPAIITTPAQSVCDGSSIKLNTSIDDNIASQYKFEWIGAAGLGDQKSATITKAGEYQVKITPPFSCPFKLSNKVQYNFDPPFTDVDILFPKGKSKPVICGAPEEASIVLTASAKDLSDVKYSWNGPNNVSLGTTDKITVSDANAGEYKLSLSHVSGTCPTSKTISVVGSFTPQINTVTPTDGRICNEKGNIVKLTATPSNATDYIYQWLGGTDGKTDLKQTTNTLSTTQTGVYALSMTQLGGNCTPKIAVKTIAVTVDEPIPNAKISPDSAVICNPTSGLSLVASADGTGISYQWTGASSTTQTLVVKKQGDYFVTYTRGKCVIPNKKITAVESKLIVKLTPETATSNKPFVICTSTTNGVAFPLQASTNISGSSLKWYLTGSTDVIDTNKIYNPKKTGDYYAVATNTKFGCTSDPSNKVSITVFDNFSVNIDPLNPKQLCEGSVQKFTAISINQNFDYSYVWSLDGNAITPSNTNFIDVRKEGNYTVAITKDGCKASSVVSKISTKPSRPIITVLDNAYLESTENVDGATAFQWYYKKANPISENDTLVSSYNLLADNTKRITVRIDEGTYMVKSNRNGCGKRFSNAIYLTKPLGMDFLDKNEWKVYPNPTTELINIENNSAIPDKAQVDLWSSTGTLISSWTQSGKTSSYNFLNLPVGTYLITISQKEKSLTTKLIKQ